MSAPVATDRQADHALAKKYAPYLVLYPEISHGDREHIRWWQLWKSADYREDGDKEHRFWFQFWRGRRNPLRSDYHPRDLEYALTEAKLPTALQRVRGWVHPSSYARLPSAWLVLTRGDVTAKLGSHIDFYARATQANRNKFWQLYKNDRAKEGFSEAYPVCAYYNVIRGAQQKERVDAKQYESLVVVQYWFFYIYNDWANTHEGDWEHADVVLAEDAGGDLRPIACAYSAHNGGLRADWDSVEKANEDGEKDQTADHPIVFVAAGSHANYFTGGRKYLHVPAALSDLPLLAAAFDTTLAKAPDKASNECIPEVRPYSYRLRDGQPTPWRRFEGRWGSRGLAQGWARKIPLLGTSYSGPTSPPEKDAWKKPFIWIEACREPSEGWLPRI